MSFSTSFSVKNLYFGLLEQAKTVSRICLIFRKQLQTRVSAFSLTKLTQCQGNNFFLNRNNSTWANQEQVKKISQNVSIQKNSCVRKVNNYCMYSMSAQSQWLTAPTRLPLHSRCLRECELYFYFISKDNADTSVEVKYLEQK